ncbi:MAG: cation:dicarboxylase symporter family transporter, partial [Planctomycetales bacterium]|nr:cation:dicarboxylase symporter family transporter [Planctomycetales bacterium]
MITPPKQVAKSGLWGRWAATPLYWRILLGMLIGIAAGLMLGDRAEWLRIPSGIILQLLSALAPPLILIAVVHVLMTSDIPRSSVARLAGLLLLNTTVAIFIGLTVANVMQPGKWSPSAPVVAATEGSGEQTAEQDGVGEPAANPFDQLLGSLPRSLLGPLGDRQNVIGVIIIAIAFGVALRDAKAAPITNITDLVEVAYRTLIVVLHWIIELVPIGVACIVAAVIGTEGFGAFVNLGAFVVAVLVALGLQTAWYLVRIHYFSWASPLQVLRGIRDALLMAFSTDSSTATMPVTYACLKEKVGVREKSASLGALVGANFNNDGT